MTKENENIDDTPKTIRATTDGTANKNENNNIRATQNGAALVEDITIKEKVAHPGAPPDGGWGWVVVASSFTISLLVDGVCFSFGIFFDEFREEFGTSKGTTSWIGSVLNGSYLIFGPIFSALVNMYGCRNVALGGAVLASVAFFLSTFSPNIGVLIFTYGFLGGLGFGLMYLPAIVMVGYYFERRRALATGIACCGSGIGAFLFAPFTEYLLHEYGWRGATWIISALLCHSFASAIFFRPLTPAAPEASMLEMGERHEEAVRLIDDDIIDMTDVRRSPKENIPEPKSSLISEKLKSEIYQRLTTMPIEDSSAGQQYTPSDTARLAFSQDFSRYHRFKEGHPGEPTHRPSVPPLQRQDIFYSGSIWHLKEFREKTGAVGSQKNLATSSDKKGFVQSFVSVFDISLLKSPTFLIYGASCFLCMFGFFVPFIYIPTHAIDLGLDSTSAAFLISIIGITNTVGRVAVGFVSDQTWADCLLINNVALICGGVATLFVPYYTYYYLLAIYAAIFGSAIAVFVSLRSIIMVELMGLEKLTTAFGFVIMCQGMSSLLGPPVAGAISDYTGNYNAAFYLAGVSLTLSGLICLPLRRIASWETGKQKLAASRERSKNNRPLEAKKEYELLDVNSFKDTTKVGV
ncbi:unnamed protein product [Candidula unifasciata]|uniref:Major facilitator superfamily (MFS) profile domain-containing protein n=1 Tax=Candidula unifasciata TaxID=100452 RepID=A0A8S4A1W1_9EUPU|nr:unnamed protein product [Candidula unifasciata]